MRKLLPFLFLFAGVFAVLGILFLLIRFDAVPTSVRSIRWRTTPPAEPEPVTE